MIPNQIDLLVSSVEYTTHDIQRHGVASQFLNLDLDIQNETVPIFLLPNEHFSLPDDPNIPIILIGPGTGIAPYRAFLQERSNNNNWLFFGERNQKTDFYYRDFLDTLVQENRLCLSTAFSRDQSFKIYVQDLIYSHKKQFWEWIQNGSILYLCGDAQRMAKDVTTTIETIFIEEGSMTGAEAKNYLKHLRKTKRFLSDVY